MATNSQPTKIQLVLVVTAIVLVAIFGIVLTPGAAMAQGCDTTEVLEVAAEAQTAGYYGVSIDLASCRIDIIFVNPSQAAAPSVPFTVTTTPFTATMPISLTAPSAPVVNFRLALDYVQDEGEISPANGAQANWIAPMIIDAMKAESYGLDPATALYDVVEIVQQMAADNGTWTLDDSGTLPVYRDFRFLIWDSNYDPNVDKLPQAVELVYCVEHADGAQSCLWLSSAMLGNRKYSGMDQVFAVR